MTVLLIGIILFALIFSLFYLKNRLQSPVLSRIAHSELVIRFAVIAVALICIGGILILSKLFA